MGSDVVAIARRVLAGDTPTEDEMRAVCRAVVGAAAAGFILVDAGDLSPIASGDWLNLLSSNLRRCRYDARVGDLIIEFHSGATWVYEGVPPAIVEGLLAAPSAGTYFNQEIKEEFPQERLKTEAADDDDDEGGSD